jgi:hypothetical protein
MFLSARCKFFLLASLLYVTAASSSVALAQDPIRVQTNQVLVRVIVADKERLRRFWKSGKVHVLPGEIETVLSGLFVHDLTVADFQVLDDGKEQPIQSVTEELNLFWNVRDNRGHHAEYMGPGGGKWSTAEFPPGLIGDIDGPQHYLIAYTVPESPEGSCHQIKVKVNRPNAVVAARGDYCNTKHSTADPANGTGLGQQLEHVLVSAEASKVNISLTAIALYSNSDAARIHIGLDWPWESLKSKTKGVLGMVFSKEGKLVTRFSDLAERQGTAERDLRDWPTRPYSDLYEKGVVETRYETQITLAPGEYELRVVLGDGKRFGRAETPLTVGVFNRKELAISAVSLCKQIDDVSAYSSGSGSILAGAWTAKHPANYVPLVSNDMEFKPTGNTRFKNGETLYTYFEVYEPSLGGQSPATVQIQIRIVDLKTGEVKSDSRPISAMPYLKEGSPVIPVGRGIDISKLPNGSYRLDVQASDSTGKSTAWRTTNFTVE